ncbi:MAG TPA: 50S ribosomal protein L3, partial [Thermoplasmata archaeon]|nr:50S ribosomal protein L3 [Thermoplasmata archaeon]
MANKRRPRRGSMGFSPRKRAAAIVPTIHAWPPVAEGEVHVQGFAGFKAGMTHAFVVDWRKTSTTAGQEIRVPVTVLEVPPIKVAAVRFYIQTVYGRRTAGEVWATSVEKDLARRLPIPKDYKSDQKWKEFEENSKTLELDDVRLLVYTQPSLITGVPAKAPELFEVRVAGGDIAKRSEFAKSLLGKEIKIKDFTSEGRQVDVVAVTKGKGYQGTIKRWGVKLLSHKNSKHRRMIANAGPKRPGYVAPTVPQSGQIGFHSRTEFNKRVIKIGETGEEITPAGGFIHFGVIHNPYILLHGSVPGPI